jgi:hypothetical protein
VLMSASRPGHRNAGQRGCSVHRISGWQGAEQSRSGCGGQGANPWAIAEERPPIHRSFVPVTE